MRDALPEAAVGLRSWRESWASGRICSELALVLMQSEHEVAARVAGGAAA